MSHCCAIDALMIASSLTAKRENKRWLHRTIFDDCGQPHTLSTCIRCEQKTTTLASFTQNGLGVKVDFSPNNDSIAVCADKGVYVIDMKHPRAMKTLVSLPGQVSGFSSPAPSLSCDNLRWSPNGQTLLVQLFVSGLAEYGNIGGWALLPLNGSQPQVIYGCGISATSSGLQVMGGLDPNCKAEGGGAFDWQPEHAPRPS